jgi:hypothetical protein
MTWIRNNTWIVSIVSTLVVAIGVGAVDHYQLKSLVGEQSEVQHHIHDTTRHLDPARDTQAQAQLLDRVKHLEEKVVRLESRGRWHGERNPSRRGNRQALAAPTRPESLDLRKICEPQPPIRLSNMPAHMGMSASMVDYSALCDRYYDRKKTSRKLEH